MSVTPQCIVQYIHIGVDWELTMNTFKGILSASFIPIFEKEKKNDDIVTNMNKNGR